MGGGRDAVGRARQVWRGTGYERGVAYATAQLGRLAARSGQAGHALTRLLDALARFRELGVEGDVQFAEALLAEAAAFAGDGETARTTADRLLADRDVGLLEPLLHRVKAIALAQRDDVEGATIELHAALDAARAQEQDYETLVALDAVASLTPGDPDAARQSSWPLGSASRVWPLRRSLPPVRRILGAGRSLHLDDAVAGPVLVPGRHARGRAAVRQRGVVPVGGPVAVDVGFLRRSAGPGRECERRGEAHLQG